MLKVASLLVFLSVLATTNGLAQETRGESPENKTQSSSAASAQKSESSSNRVVLKVGAKPVTEAEFEANIGDLEPKGGGDPDKATGPDKDRRELGDDYASVMMLSQMAVANHLDAS